MSSNSGIENPVPPQEIKLKALHSWLSGFLLCLPIVYPSQPYYVFSFLIFFSMLFYIPQLENKKVLFGVTVAMTLGILSNLISEKNGQLDLFRSIYTSFYFAFFLFGWLLPDKKSFVRGYCFCANILSILVLYYAFKLQIFKYGWLLLSMPEYRLWGFDIFPDWPNFFALFLTIGLLSNLIINKRPLWAFVNCLAAILTTSRTPFIGIALIFAYYIISVRSRITKIVIASGMGLGILGIGAMIAWGNLGERMLLISDRTEIYSYALKLFAEAPLFGNGSVLMDKSVGHLGFPSYHNSYLDILVRHGLVGLSLFLILLLPPGVWRKSSFKIMAPLLFTFLLGSFFQNFLKHPHLIMIYTVFLASCYQARTNDRKHET
jgi:hypothetical protein